jgi:16S rRNA (cytidine1402-2'-O)-methyltransferase
LAELADERRTMVFFEAPHRLEPMLDALVEAFGPDRPAVVCLELTKTHEEVVRSTLGELAQWSRAGVRGEITVVVAGAPVRVSAQTPDELAARVIELADAGLNRKEAIAEVARETGLPKREVFDAVVAAKPRG